MYFENYAEPDMEVTKTNYKRAVKMLADNVVRFECYKRPVLTTGRGYPGIWLEHNHDSLFYTDIDAEIAKNSHRIFYDFQVDDGLFPAYICKWPHEEAYRIGYGHMQTVYPLAASAVTIAQKTGDEEFLRDSYEACSKYDAWIRRYRNTRGTGLAEVFCGFDTGHDNSSRIADMPQVCPHGNARLCPDEKHLPIIAPDMSAMMYRAEIALGDMAEQLGRGQESRQWRSRAEEIKEKLVRICYDAKDGFFYDVDANGNYRRYLTEHIFRLFVNGVVSQELFDKIYERYISEKGHFNTPYPFASISASAPYFDINLTENNWNGKTQMHTVLETLFWMEQYGRGDALRELMSVWINRCNDSNMICSQEANPFSGEFSTKAPAFTTTLIMYVEFVKRLYNRR